ASRRLTKFTPLTTRPSLTSRHGMTRTLNMANGPCQVSSIVLLASRSSRFFAVASTRTKRVVEGIRLVPCTCLYSTKRIIINVEVEHRYSLGDRKGQRKYP